MSAESVAKRDLVLEVEKLPRPGDRPDKAVKKVHCLPEQSLDEAKKAWGRAFKVGRGTNPQKVFGPENVISGVESGDKVPDYMARMYQNDDAVLRFAKELVKGRAGVRTRNVTVIEWDEEEAV